MIQNGIEPILQSNSRIPVVTFNSTDEVETILQRLIYQGVNCIEITLRTDAAVASIKKCKSIAPPDFNVGVGTVISKEQVKICMDLQVDFMVSPGSSAFIVEEMQNSGIPYLPGVMTPTEIITAVGRGCSFLKLFPFNIAGGEKAIKSYSKVFPSVKFCPTGGVGKNNFQDLLDMDNVICVGGSWLVK